MCAASCCNGAGWCCCLRCAPVALLWTAVSNWRQSREVNAKIAALNSEIAALDRQHDEALAMVQLPQNRPVVDDSKFLNGLIARKSFSWTRVFMQLEQIMPPKLHVVSISPELQPKTNTVEVHLTVAGTSRDAAVELVKRLEQSPSFRNARIEEESAVKLQKESTDTVQFHLTAVYVPQPVPAAGRRRQQPVAGQSGKAAEPSCRGQTRIQSRGTQAAQIRRNQGCRNQGRRSQRRAAMTVDLRDVRTQLLIAVAVLLLLDMAAMAVLLSPAGRSRSARQQQYEQLRLVKMEKTRLDRLHPGHGPEDCHRPRAGAGLQPRPARRALFGDVGAVVAHCGRGRRQRLRRKIRRACAKDKEKTTPPGYDGIGITIQVHGSYAQDMRFINAVERQKMLLLIDAVSFGGMQGDELTVSVHLSTYLRSAA